MFPSSKKSHWLSEPVADLTCAVPPPYLTNTHRALDLWGSGQWESSPRVSLTSKGHAAKTPENKKAIVF